MSLPPWPRCSREEYYADPEKWERLLEERKEIGLRYFRRQWIAIGVAGAALLATFVLVLIARLS